MTDEVVEDMIRRAIGGDRRAIARIRHEASSSADAVVVVMAALLGAAPAALERARGLATSSRDRQVVEIARAHLAGEAEQVDALARDHLVDHPGSLIVAWIAADAAVRARSTRLR